MIKEVFLQPGYQPQPEEGKSIKDYDKIKPPKTNSNAVYWNNKKKKFEEMKYEPMC